MEILIPIIKRMVICILFKKKTKNNKKRQRNFINIFISTIAFKKIL